jgi:hypothetical protein
MFDVGTKQEFYEWEWYYNLLENLTEISHGNPNFTDCSYVLDIRGNHDGMLI